MTYLDSEANEAEYELPDGVIMIESVLVSFNGKDLSTTNPADSDATEMFRTTMKDAVGRKDLNLVGSDEGLVYLTDDQFNPGNLRLGIVPTPEVTASSNIKVVWTGSTEYLVNPTDEPMIDREDHDKLCRDAATRLRLGPDQRIDDLVAFSALDQDQFRVSGKRKMRDNSERTSIAGLTRRSRTIKTGGRRGKA